MSSPSFSLALYIFTIVRSTTKNEPYLNSPVFYDLEVSTLHIIELNKVYWTPAMALIKKFKEPILFFKIVLENTTYF